MQVRAAVLPFVLSALALVAACGTSAPARTDVAPGGMTAPGPVADAVVGSGPAATYTQEQVLRGRALVIGHACGDCHGGTDDPASPAWLAGRGGEADFFPLDEYRVWPRNLTSDSETGLARYTDRQVFNALRYGLRPGETPDIEITSATPGVGNHPARPNYLAPAMPWVAMRHMSDDELRDIIAYLRHVRPVRNDPPAGVRPPDFWASTFVQGVPGPFPAPPFPTDREQLSDPSRREQVLQGRQLVVSLGCGECHGGWTDPASLRWLAGVQSEPPPGAAPFEIAFPVGPFTTYPRNLTPDNTTGLGRFTERQLFNSLRWGLRPGETADVEITSPVPGQGNHPANPKYLAPPMPWPSWRHLPDAEIRAIVAYLKLGVQPVRNRVPDSEGPPDFWLGTYGAEPYGRWPAPAFPTARERRPGADD